MPADLGLEDLLRRLVREEVRAALADVLGEAPPGADDCDLRRLAKERAAKLKRARPQ